MALGFAFYAQGAFFSGFFSPDDNATTTRQATARLTTSSTWPVLCDGPEAQHPWYCRASSWYTNSSSTPRRERVKASKARSESGGLLAWLGAYFRDAFIWAVNVMGEAALGEYWAHAKATVVLLVATTCGTALLYNLDFFLRPLCWLARSASRLRRRIWPRDGDGPAPLRATDLECRGPGTAEEPDNDFYKDVIRGRNGQRAANHLLLSIEGETVRIEKGTQKAKPASRHGQRFGYGEVVSSTSQRLRRMLEEPDEARKFIHLC